MTEEMIKNIEQSLNSEKFINLLKEDWNKFHNISLIGNMIGEVYLYNIIHKDGFSFDEYLDNINSLYVKHNNKEISPENFELEKNKLLAISIAKKLNIDVSKQVSIEDQERIKEYFIREYVTNGFVAHSFPESSKESIIKNGLSASPTDRIVSGDEIIEINEIFKNKGINNALGGAPYYKGGRIYYEHDFSNVFQHTINSPEWFNWFTSSDHTSGFQKIEDSPYILRDKETCKRNVADLCINAELNEEETEKVITFFAKNYVKFSSPKLNVALIPKEVVNKDKMEIPKLDLLSTISYVLKDKCEIFKEHIGNIYLGTIDSKNIGFTTIPETNKYIDKIQYLRETKEKLLKSQKDALLRIQEFEQQMPENKIK